MKLIKFISVGATNTIAGYSVYALLIMLNISYLTSLLLATIIGVVFNYFSIGRLVFKSEGGSITFVKFVVTYGIIYLINAAALSTLITIFQVGAYVGQVLCVPISAFISWILMNYWVYKND